MKSRLAIALLVGVAALLGGSLPAAYASAGPAGGRQAPSTTGGAALPGLVSQKPVTYTPDVYAGSTCGKACEPASTVYSTAVVNGEVVVAGAFTQVCSPAPASPASARCPAMVPASYIFAFNPATGVIDPGFTPVLSNGPVYSLAAGPDGTVYAGGAFTTVDGTSTGGLARLSVTPGQATDGQLVPGFTSQVTGVVRSLAVSGGALYAGGSFRTADEPFKKVVRLDASTGAVDKRFKFTIGDPFPGEPLDIKTIALSPDGTTLAIAGTFQTVNGQSVPRLALISTGGGLHKATALDDWAAPILTNECSHQHDYVDGISFSPDGSFFVIADTGYQSDHKPGLCDAAARFETGATGSDVQPAWVNYTGGDSLDSVAVTGGAVYVGGHQRWGNNECGLDSVCEANAVLVDGVAALDANTGLAVAWWHPQTARGIGVQSLTPYPAGTFAGSDGGLLLGTSVDSIGGADHHELAMFPMTTSSAGPAGGPIMPGMFSDGRPGGADETTEGPAALCVDDTGGGSTPGTPVELSTCVNDAEQNWTAQGQTITSNGLCLDTRGGGTASATPVVTTTCDGGATQNWRQGPGDTLVNQGAGICLDDPGASTTSGTQLDIATCDGAAAQSWPLPAAPAPPPPPATGSLYPQDETENLPDVPCATVDGAAKSSDPVVLRTCLGLSGQKWTAELDGTLQLQGLCLDTRNEATAPGTPAVLATCAGSPAQVWTAKPGYALVNQASGLCLDDPGSKTTTGTPLDVATCDGGSNQQWRLPAS